MLCLFSGLLQRYLGWFVVLSWQIVTKMSRRCTLCFFCTKASEAAKTRRFGWIVGLPLICLGCPQRSGFSSSSAVPTFGQGFKANQVDNMADGAVDERKMYEHPLVRRYATKEMSYIFSPEKKFSTWRLLWIALAKAERELGESSTSNSSIELENEIEQ